MYCFTTIISLLFFRLFASESSPGRVDWPKKKGVVSGRVGDWVGRVENCVDRVGGRVGDWVGRVENCVDRVGGRVVDWVGLGRKAWH